MNPLISVIVPVYNVEPYLRKCIDSIISQTYTNLEIILVDDGSPDNCGCICDEYARVDNRIKVIHKANGGLSDARNAGLDICRGEYIGFVDSDDWIAEDMYEALYNFASDNDLDVAMCTFFSAIEDAIISPQKFAGFVTDKKHDIIETVFTNRYPNCGFHVWSKLYKKDIIADSRFDLGKWYEDIFFGMKWIEKTKRFGLIASPKYFYLERKGSITKSFKFDKRVFHSVEAREKNLDIVKKLYPEAIECAEYSLIGGYLGIIGYIKNCEDGKQYSGLIDNLQKILRQYRSKFLKSKYGRLRQKTIFLLISWNTNSYIIARKIYRLFFKRFMDKLW